MHSDTHALLVLSRIPGIGSYRLRTLVSRFGSAAAVESASGAALITAEGIDRRTASAILAYFRGPGAAEGRAFADAQAKRLDRIGGRIVTWWEPDYPPLLKRSDDPPPMLYIRGTLEKHDAGSIAIVGTRSPTPYGVQMAEQFASGLAGLGIAVVSGLARGIDTVAHATCVRIGQRTLGVIGSGLDVMYPAENLPLAERIAAHGAVMTELPFGAKPDAVNFPRRNRIVSGMTLGTLVIETGPDGGAMITAALALDQGREVFAIPSAVASHRKSGTNALIRDGKAKLTESIDDILVEIAPRLKSVLPGVPVNRPPSPVPDLTLFERNLADLLDDDPIHIDSLAAKAGLATGEALVHLLSLEFKGVARQLPGKMFRRV